MRSGPGSSAASSPGSSPVAITAWVMASSAATDVARVQTTDAHWGPGTVEIRHPGVGGLLASRRPGLDGHDLAGARGRSRRSVEQGDAGGGGPVNLTDRHPAGRRLIAAGAGPAGEWFDMCVHGWLLPSGSDLATVRPPGPAAHAC